MGNAPSREKEQSEHTDAGENGSDHDAGGVTGRSTRSSNSALGSFSFFWQSNKKKGNRSVTAIVVRTHSSLKFAPREEAALAAAAAVAGEGEDEGGDDALGLVGQGAEGEGERDLSDSTIGSKQQQKQQHHQNMMISSPNKGNLARVVPMNTYMLDDEDGMSSEDCKSEGRDGGASTIVSAREGNNGSSSSIHANPNGNANGSVASLEPKQTVLNAGSVERGTEIGSSSDINNNSSSGSNVHGSSSNHHTDVSNRSGTTEQQQQQYDHRQQKQQQQPQLKQQQPQENNKKNEHSSLSIDTEEDALGVPVIAHPTASPPSTAPNTDSAASRPPPGAGGGAGAGGAEDIGGEGIAEARQLRSPQKGVTGAAGGEGDIGNSLHMSEVSDISRPPSGKGPSGGLSSGPPTGGGGGRGVSGGGGLTTQSGKSVNGVGDAAAAGADGALKSPARYFPGFGSFNGSFFSRFHAAGVPSPDPEAMRQWERERAERGGGGGARSSRGMFFWRGELEGVGEESSAEGGGAGSGSAATAAVTGAANRGEGKSSGIGKPASAPAGIGGGGLRFCVICSEEAQKGVVCNQCMIAGLIVVLRDQQTQGGNNPNPLGSTGSTVSTNFSA